MRDRVGERVETIGVSDDEGVGEGLPVEVSVPLAVFVGVKDALEP